MSTPLDPVELAVLKDREFMPVKQRVTQKLEQQLTQLGHDLLAEVERNGQHLPSAIRAQSPKLSRGENYQSYAYRVMDYPRVFGKEDMLAFRSMVLWGHPVGYHLMLAGQYRAHYREAMVQAIPRLPEGYLLSAQRTPWRWEPDHELLPAHQLTAETVAEIIEARAFIKVSYFLPLTEIETLISTGLAVWRRWQTIL
jgi:hypothetical protein